MASILLAHHGLWANFPWYRTMHEETLACNDAAGRGASVGFGKYGAAAEAEPLRQYDILIILNYLILSCLMCYSALRNS